jgi:hypothetical protein
MLTGSTIFTGLIEASDVTSVITQYGYVIAGLVVITLLLAPLFLAKGGFQWVLSKVSKAVGAGR